MNNHYIQSLDDDDLAARCLHFLDGAPGCSPEPALLRARDAARAGADEDA